MRWGIQKCLHYGGALFSVVPIRGVLLHTCLDQRAQSIAECTAIPPHAAHHVVHKSADMQFMQDHGMACEGESR